MPKDMDNTLLESLDMSILGVDLSFDGDKLSSFWRLSQVSADMAGSLRKSPKSVAVETIVCRDHGQFAELIARKHAEEEAPKPPVFRTPPELDDQISECTPQFTLRNIPKIERYYDLTRRLNFEAGESPLELATADIEEVRNARIESVEFTQVQSADIIDDYRIFLEEIFYLCPWDQITRRAPEPDSPWHVSHSRAKLAQYLLDRQNTLFIYGDRGASRIGTKAFVPEESLAEGETRPKGGSFGPI